MTRSPSPPGAGPAGDDALLRRILEATARATGAEFFRTLTRHLALASAGAVAIAAATDEQRRRALTLAVWGGGRFHDPFEYDVAGTPCEPVVRGESSHHTDAVQRRFPTDRRLRELGVESYVGVPFFDDVGDVLGHLAVLGAAPMPSPVPGLATLELFAARAAAELQRLRIQQQLVESERRFRDLFEEAPIGYVYEDTQTRFVSANRSAIRMLGLRPEEVTSTVGMSLVAPTRANQQRVQESLQAEQTGREKPFIEIELRRKDDGRPVWVQRFSRPEPDGRHTRTMIVDITDRVLAEQERSSLRQQNAYLREEIQSAYDFDEIVGASTGLRASLAKVEQVAGTDSTVLILGETGTGKELIARALHSNSRRRERPLIKLNCAALPTGLVESELFGHEKGAFTGALARRVGRFALADGGTIFLDEIGDVPPDVQVRLLRVLQEHEFEPVGSPHTVRVDVRVIAATNRDLLGAVAAGEFRKDLYYRLNVFPIVVPPLRERREDVPLLAQYFATRYAGRLGRQIDAIAPQTLQRLVDYPWPGNVRELENVVERAVILATDNTLRIDAAQLGAAALTAPPGPAAAATATAAEHARAHLLAALERAGWRVDGPRGAARALGLHPNTLRSRMKRLGLRRPDEVS